MGQGFFDEYKDVLAIFTYVASHEQLKNMAIGLFNPCAGGNLALPTLITQNKDDVWTFPDDVQTTFDLIATNDKKLHCIEIGDTCRFIGHNFFGENPEMMVKWFDKFVK